MSEHEATVTQTAATQTAAPVEDHATTPAGDVLAGLPAIGAAGNAAVARQIHSSGCHLAGLSLAGNAAVRRALGQPGLGGGAAPSGFTDRLGKAEAGQPIPDEPRQSLETSFGTSLADVRLHVGSQSGELAAEVSANAFTVNKDIYFGDGQFAPGSQQGYHLLAHEVTHTLQQGGAVSASSATVSDPADASEREAEDVATRVTQQRAAGPVQGTAPDVMRDATDLIPDFILDGVKSAISAIPGYDLLAGIIGKDPITDQPVRMNRTELIEKLLTYGPFGANVGQVLQAVDVLGDVYTLVTDGLSANNLTMARIERDIGAAWDEISVTNGIDGNAAIVRRYVDAILNDISGFVRGIVGQVIEKVRAVVAEVAEPHLQDPQIKPVWDLARKVLHYDPLRGEDVNAPTVEILGDFLRLIGKEDALAQMTERGTLQQTADWLDTQFATFVSIKNDLLQLFADAWDAISPQNLPNLLDTLPRLAQRAFDLVRRIGAFATTVLAKVLELVKVSLLGWLSQHAHEMPGFRLMTVMLGQNPFTGDTVPRTAANLIGGFITLLPNGEATYRQLAESGVIDEAAGRIESAMTRLNITTELITGTFLGIWNSLSLEDLLAPIPAFERILARFSDPLNRIIEFATEVVKVVIELILKLMNFPSDLIGSIISNAMTAIEDIKRDPVAFLLNMLQALKSGFMGFFDNILPYLLDGLTSWLLRGLGQIGITRPADLSLESVLGLALQVLGITADSLWQKVGEHIGPERMQQMRNGVDRLSGAWQFIKDVQEGGAAAIWRYVTDQLSNLWDTVIEMAKNWIMSEIVEKVTTKLISMLDPTGVMAVINSMVAFFNAIQSAIEYLRDILTIVNDYVTTFAQVAAGNIVPGAQKITEGLGHAVPIAIGFLANQVGLGNIPEKIVEIIGGLREMVDQAIDWLIQQAISLGQSAMNALGLGGEQPETPAETPAAPGTLSPHDVVFAATSAALDEKLQADDVDVTQAMQQVEADLAGMGLKSLRVEESDGRGTGQIVAQINPKHVLGNLSPGAPEPQMVCHVTVEFLGAAELGEVEPGTNTAASGEDFNYLQPGSNKNPRARGGAVFVPDPQAPNQLDMKTWNSADKPSHESNADHAERHLTAWLDSLRSRWADIEKVTVANDPYSPCTECGPQLQGKMRQINAARRAAGRADVNATLSWTVQWSTGPTGNGTKPGTIPDMHDWVVTPSNVARPTGTTREDLKFANAMDIAEMRRGLARAGVDLAGLRSLGLDAIREMIAKGEIKVP
jgi:hypothetical protein